MISIIIPVYNADRFLEECVESALNQSYKELEVLLIDDGSTDSSPEICDKFAKKDRRVRVFHGENRGVSETRNKGIRLARGEYIMFFDSDDYADPALCERLLGAVEHDGTDFAFCSYNNVASSGIKPRKLYDGSRVFKNDDFRNEIQTATLGLNGENLTNPERIDKLTPIWARLYKTAIIRLNNVYYVDLNKVPSECLLFNFEYSLHARSASYVDEPLYYYRRNTGISVTKPYREDLWDKWSYWTQYAGGLVKDDGNRKDMLLAYCGRLCSAVIPLGGNAMKKPTRRERLAEMKSFLSHDEFEKAFNHFDYSRCAFYWKLFFGSAKKRRVRMFYFLTWSMRKILSYRKN